MKHGLEYCGPEEDEDDEELKDEDEMEEDDEDSEEDPMSMFVTADEKKSVTVLDPVVAFRQDKVFDFDRLLKEAPAAIGLIAKYTMTKDKPINVIVRLDKFDVYPPIQGGLDPRTGLPFRFFWDEGKCAINSAPLPKDVLAPLLVNKTWLEIFGTCFYATNTFSFQSLGEFGIFTERIGRARRHRIQHINLWWIGSRMKKSYKESKKSKDKYSLRTWSLRHLTGVRRLKTLKIFLDECSKNRMRRKHEPKFVFNRLEKATRSHENKRKFRDLRKLLGLDWAFQLRGIEYVEVYNYGAPEPLTKIHDQSFVDDLRAQVMQPKKGKKAEYARVNKLSPLLKGPPGAPQGGQLIPQMQMLLYHFLDKEPIPREMPSGARAQARNHSGGVPGSPLGASSAEPAMNDWQPVSSIWSADHEDLTDPKDKSGSKRENSVKVEEVVKNESPDLEMEDVNQQSAATKPIDPRLKTANSYTFFVPEYDASNFRLKGVLDRQARLARENCKKRSWREALADTRRGLENLPQ